MQYDDQDESFWDSGQEYRKRQTAKERCKERKNKSIRQGINDYWDKRSLRHNLAGSYDDFDDDDDTGQLDDVESQQPRH
ncbi:hypothetical protein [Endozoicomonas numazuensis]|uniref:Uncharacterized protein n=1 Tax=Endozoicomonas numazuensis TaxID=1137799 RepID=A0A081NM09_9GAMM|nr:hypothetical protein [Endozoicomonas numazuensis]KEQ19482.1 hypothetical protein GZ78_06000 [Endozoicomonas numazuensis]